MSSELTHVLDGIATWLGILGLIPVSLFIYYYGSEPVPGHRLLRRYSRAWKTFMASRLLMYMMMTWVLFIILVGFRYFLPADYPFEYLRIGVYAVLIIIFTGMFYALRKVQRAGQDARVRVEGESSVPRKTRVRIRKPEDRSS